MKINATLSQAMPKTMETSAEAGEMRAAVSVFKQATGSNSLPSLMLQSLAQGGISPSAMAQSQIKGKQPLNVMA